MKNISFYEQAGIVIPGAVLLFGVMFFVSELRDVLARGGMSVGGLGIFVIISYAFGQLLAALGNGIEKLHWWWYGGMPSNWIVGPEPRLLSPTQIAKVHAFAVSRLHLACPALSEQTAKTWFPIFRQIYSDVEKHGKPGRGDAFNGMYGLNRGLCAATLALAIVVLAHDRGRWPMAVSLVVAASVYLYRMHRFGVHYAREIYNQFLLLPPSRSHANDAVAMGGSALGKSPVTANQ